MQNVSMETGGSKCISGASNANIYTIEERKSSWKSGGSQKGATTEADWET